MQKLTVKLAWNLAPIIKKIKELLGKGSGDGEEGSGSGDTGDTTPGTETTTPPGGDK